MKKIDSIIQILQKELIIRKKRYFTISQATKILSEKGILSKYDISSNYLKSKIEKGEIPQAIKTALKTQQWRIHKDKIYKKKKATASNSKSNYTKKKKKKEFVWTENGWIQVRTSNYDQVALKCPICGFNVIVPAEYRYDDRLCCENCNNKLSNQNISKNGYWSEYNKKYPNFKYVLIIAIIFLILYFVGLNNDPDNDEYIDNRAKIMMLKEKGLATDKDIKHFDDAYRKSKKKK